MKAHLSIPEPCPANWDEMKPNQDGRFCTQCSKSVVDVTNWSDDEVLQEYTKRGGMCIRIPENRLTTPVSKPRYYVKWAVALFAIWLGVKAKVEAAIPLNFSTKNHTTPDSTEIKTVSKMVVEGTVYDSTDGNMGVVGVSVTISRGDSILGQTTTDVTGSFNLNLSNLDFTSEDCSVKVVMFNSTIAEKTFSPRDSVDIDIYIKEAHICMNEVVIVRPSRLREDMYYAGIPVMTVGVLVSHKHNEVSIFNNAADQYDTKQINSDELEKFNLGR